MNTFRTLALALPFALLSMSALAEDPICVSCADVNNPNIAWEFNEDKSTSTLDVAVEDNFYNQAELASGGRASDKNRSDFNNQTTTITETTTNYFDAYNTNRNYTRAPGQDQTDSLTTVISTTTVKVKVK